MDGMASHFGILYAEDFDDPQPPSTPEPEPPPRSYTPAELEAAPHSAGADAVRAARAEWDQSALHDRTQSLSAIAAALAGSQHEARLLAETVADGAVRTILSVLDGLLPDLCARHGAAEVRALLRHLLPTLSQQPRVAVRVSTAVIDSVRNDLALLDDDVAASIVLTTAALLPGDARVTWTDGSLVRDETAIRAAIASALTELGLLEPATTPTNKRSMAYAE